MRRHERAQYEWHKREQQEFIEALASVQRDLDKCVAADMADVYDILFAELWQPIYDNLRRTLGPEHAKYAVAHSIKLARIN